MYKFADTRKHLFPQETILPISAMEYDGMYFEQEIVGYRTLYVEGREMLSPQVDVQSVNRGVIVTDQSLPERILTVHYMIENNDPDDILVEFRRLLNLLYRSEDVKIKFNDELDVFYQGRFSSAETPPGNVYSFTSSFSILCSDPYKFSEKLYVTDEEIKQEFPYKITPEYLKVTTRMNGPTIITDGLKSIKISSLLPNSGIRVEFRHDETNLYVNGDLLNKKLELDSDLENFYLFKGQKIACNNGPVEVGYRTVML